MKQRVHQVIINGQVVAQRVTTRKYTHAVIRWKHKKYLYGRLVNCAEPRVDKKDVEFCGSRALAERKLSRMKSSFTTEEIVPVNYVVKTW